MMKCILISLVICSFFVSSSSSQSQIEILPSKQEVKKTYAFEYLVKDEHERTQFGRKEQSDGKKVQGVYSVNLPDGRHQTVHYEVEDDTGFRASVTYKGEAKLSPKTEKADKTNRKTSKIHNQNKSPSLGAIPVPILMSISDHKPKIILKRPNTSIKTKPNSKPGIVQNILSSIKQFSEQFSENLNGLNQIKPHKANPKPISNISPVGHDTQLPVIKPEATEASLSVSHHPNKKLPQPTHHIRTTKRPNKKLPQPTHHIRTTKRPNKKLPQPTHHIRTTKRPNKKLPQPTHHIRTTKRSSSHGNLQHRPHHPSLQLPSVYNINTEPIKGPEPYLPPDTHYSPEIHKPPPDRPIPKYRPYTPPPCLGCG